MNSNNYNSKWSIYKSNNKNNIENENINSRNTGVINPNGYISNGIKIPINEAGNKNYQNNNDANIENTSTIVNQTSSQIELIPYSNTNRAISPIVMDKIEQSNSFVENNID